MPSTILEGIRNGEFFLEYQPQMTADGSRLAAVEALVRWRHPVRGLISPGDFMEAVETPESIHLFGAHVLRLACADAARWPHISVAVNVSAMQLHRPDFAEMVENCIAAAGVLPGQIELEIVESALIEDFDLAVRVLTRLRAKGLRIALDDFGTGYSSLTYLLKLPLDKIKIDKSFVRGVEKVQSAAIVQAVVALGRALGLKITAEGVETEAQQRFLCACGVHFLQGYLYSKPVGAEEVSALAAAPILRPPRAV